MPQAAIAFAVWVGSSAAFAATAVGISQVAAAAIGFATIGATVAAEVYAVNAAVSAVTPKIKDPGQTLQWQSDPRAGIPYPMGRCAVGGKIVFNQSAPADTRKFLNFVTVYSGVPADAFEAYQANGVEVSFTADGGEGASGYYLNRMWMRSQLGHEAASWLHWTATGSKDTPADHGGMPTEWTSDHLTTGYAATLVGMEYDTKRYASGVPTPRMIGRWAKTYDPRQDSTYPGGSPTGTHRWNDENTWTWSRCPYRNGLSWSIGRRNNGQLILGLGYEIEEIDVPSFVHGMNVSDANGWTMGGEVGSDDEPWEALKGILQAGAGYPILGGTQLSVMVNAPAVSVATITEADVVGAMTVPAQVTANDRINTIWPSYTEEALDWQVVTPDAPVQVAEYVEVDGEERSIPLGLPLVQDATQVGQLCRYAIEDARELNGIVLACKPWAQWIAPGLCITANVPSAGLNGQKLRVQKRKRDPSTMVVTFITRTETDGKHAFALGQTNTPPETPALSGGGSVDVALPAGDAWQIVGGQIAGESGSLPAIVIAGEADLHDAVSIVVDYREIAPETGDWQSAMFPASSRTLAVQGLKPGATYQVRVRYITAKGLEDPDANTDLGAIVVGDVLPGGAVLASIDAASADARAAALAVIEEATDRALADDIIDRALHTPDGLPLGPTVREQKTITDDMVETVHLIAVKTPDGAAVVSTGETVIIDPETGETRAERDASLLAADGDNYAAIAAEEIARTDADEAEALARLALRSDFEGNVASVDAALLTLGNADSAMSALIVALDSEVAGNKASADASLATLTTATSALSSALTALDSEVDSNKASADSSITTLTTATSALSAAQLALETEVDDNKASADVSLAALADETSAQASSLATLSASVDGVEATVTTQGLVLADHDGKLLAYAKWTAAAGDEEAYVELVASDDDSLLNLVARSIRLGDVDGAVITVEDGQARITNARIDGAQIDELTVGTIKITDGAISNAVNAFTATALSITAGVPTAIQTVAITTTGKRVSISSTFSFVSPESVSFASPGAGTIAVRRSSDGGSTWTTLSPWAGLYPKTRGGLDGDASYHWYVADLVTVQIADTPTAGSYVYGVFITPSIGGDATNRFAEVEEMKK